MIENIQKSRYLIIFLLAILATVVLIRKEIRNTTKSLSITLTNDAQLKKELTVMYDVAKREVIAQADSVSKYKESNKAKDSIILADKARLSKLQTLVKTYERTLDSIRYNVVKYDDYHIRSAEK